jgi:alpha-beta hydrolase superfamily lysophospholipase
MVAAARDPVGGASGAFTDLQKRYQQLGVKDLTATLYPEGRHELLNDINRDTVTADVARWLEART